MVQYQSIRNGGVLGIFKLQGLQECQVVTGVKPKPMGRRPSHPTSKFYKLFFFGSSNLVTCELNHHVKATDCKTDLRMRAAGLTVH